MPDRGQSGVSSLQCQLYRRPLAWAILIGVALRMASDHTKSVSTIFPNALTKVVRWIISLAPIGILGLVFTAVTESGMSIFTEYGKLILLLVCSMLAVALIFNPLVVFLVHPSESVSPRLQMSEGKCHHSIFHAELRRPIFRSTCSCANRWISMRTSILSPSLWVLPSIWRRRDHHQHHDTCCRQYAGYRSDLPTAIILSILSAVAACGASGVAEVHSCSFRWPAASSASPMISLCRWSESVSLSASIQTPSRQRSTLPPMRFSPLLRNSVPGGSRAGKSG